MQKRSELLKSNYLCIFIILRARDSMKWHPGLDMALIYNEKTANDLISEMTW